VPRPPPVVAWWLASRPRTLTLAVAPVVVGSALAWAEAGVFAWPVALAAVLAAVLIQVGTNLHNDASDFLRGADPPERLGPPRATAQGWLAAPAVLLGSYVAFGLAFLLGLYLVVVGGWPILLLGVLSLLAGLAYTGGPRPIAYGALGELFVFLFFGVAAVAGTYYLHALHLSPAALAAGIALGGPAAAVLLLNNYRDVETDRRVGRLTLAARLGPRASRRLYAVLVLAPFALPAVLHGVAGLAGAWLGWLALPAALGLVGALAEGAGGPALNRLLARTARLQLLYGGLLSLGLLAGPW
jgi:1,4-dihydroxy-2-naphthoate octaprenyltransferase